jgi:hypothetical protein
VAGAICRECDKTPAATRPRKAKATIVERTSATHRARAVADRDNGYLGQAEQLLWACLGEGRGFFRTQVRPPGDPQDRGCRSRRLSAAEPRPTVAPMADKAWTQLRGQEVAKGEALRAEQRPEGPPRWPAKSQGH